MKVTVPPDVVQKIKNDAGLLGLADVGSEELAANARIVGNPTPLGRPPKTATWFIPRVDNVLKGGVRTIFSVAEEMSKRWNTQNIFVVYSYGSADFSVSELEDGFARHFPSLRFLLVKHAKGGNIQHIPESDVAFCTLWTTAYLLAKYNQTRKKFYFLQDYEPVFYPAGSVYGVIEATYRFGFSGIANTIGVAQKYQQYNSCIMSFCPGVDRSIYYPDPKARLTDGRKRIVFYGRPANDRNAFALGLETLRYVKAAMGNKVDIISVGGEWDPALFRMDGVLVNQGVLPTLQKVADLYRSSDVGLVFMFSAHPSYQPFEYMACGCVTATNANESNEWLLQNDRNCLFLNPAPRGMAEEIVALLSSEDRLRRLRARGLDTVAKYSWSKAYDEILQFIAN